MITPTLLSQGLHLFIGATATGKTHSMHAVAYQHLAQGARVISFEDPVEFEMKTDSPGSFIALRADECSIQTALRADPDLILLGTISDKKTAQLAARFVETGHCVLADMHSASETAAKERFRSLADLDVDVPIASVAYLTKSH